MTGREHWRANSRRAYETAMRALDYVAAAKDVALDGRPDRNTVLLTADEARVALNRSVVQFVTHARIEITTERERIHVFAPHEMPSLRDASDVESLVRQATASTSRLLDATTVYDGSAEFEIGVAPMRHALRIHVARALAARAGRHPNPSPSIASGSVPFAGRPTVVLRIHGADSVAHLDAPGGVDPFPLPPFGRVAYVDRDNGSGRLSVSVTIRPVAITAAMTRLPEDPVQAARLIRDTTAPVLLPRKAGR